MASSTDAEDSFVDAVRMAAVEAGAAILDLYAGPVAVEAKLDQSPVTQADVASHQILVNRLRQLDPSIPILSEEGAHEPLVTRSAWRRFWCVDPLDGTKEFIKRTGEFTVNIALVEDGRPTAGVVHVPVQGVTYTAVGGRAFKRSGNGGPQPVRTRVADERQLIVVASRDHAGPEVAAIVERMTADGRDVEAVSMGSSLKFCLVAEGAADFYPRTIPTMEWDTAAAQAIVEAAGGGVYTADGARLGYNKANLRNPSVFTVGDPALDWHRYLGKPAPND